MTADSGVRPARRWRILLAHDATASTCDSLAFAVEAALGNVDITDASSADDARVALRTGTFDVCMVCLDLPPAPLGGARLAKEVLDQGHPLVLITRSLRWIPASANILREQPWIPPDAPVGDVVAAIGDAIALAMEGRPQEQEAYEPAHGRRRAAG
ncbi:MAG: hypothetical protein U0359_35490 [Byssovorax sp.]